VKSGGASFAFAKATESTNFNDPMFATNWSGMKEAGLVRGAYHFFDPAADPTAQATFFLAAVGPVSPGDLLVLDFETSGGESDSTLSSAAATFLSAVQTTTGVTPLLYASSQFLSDFGPLGVYPLWVANYGVSCPDVPAAWTTYTFWQSSGSGSAPGISGQVDVDSFNGTLAQLQALGGTGPGDAGTTVPDTGSMVPTDSGMGTDIDSGTSSNADSGTATVDSGTETTDSGAPTVADSGSSATGDAGRGVYAGDSGTGAYPTSSNKGCACTAGKGGPEPGPALATLGVVLIVAGSRRRRSRDRQLS
jgi:MYXO-CTERM domain-containing protein